MNNKRLTKVLINIRSNLVLGSTLNDSIIKLTKGAGTKASFHDTYSFIIQTLIEKYNYNLVLEADNYLSIEQKIKLIDYAIKKSELILFI
jgi:hypothetical protein